MSRFCFFLTILIITISGTMACKKNEQPSGPVDLKTVWTNTVDTVPRTITTVKVGSWIRLAGSGFSGLKQVYFNGTSVNVNANYISDTSITLQVPSSLPLPGDSTIRVVTNHGEDSLHPFAFTPAQ